MIPKAKIESVIQEVDIVKLIGDYIPLQKKGRNYFAICPFHNDNNPSMAINRDKKIYKCFSCGASGNAIKFVENYLHVSFLEALKKVAELTSIDLSDAWAQLKTIPEKYNAEQKILFQINEDALMFFKVSLASRYGRVATNYLHRRNLTSEEIEKWQLGWSTSEVSLYEHLLNKGYTIEQLKQASLISVKNNQINNYFNQRLIFPIRDLDNNVIGFSGRSLEQTKEVKYLNVRETKTFKKAHILFNIQHALMAINKSKTIIITEGFMDVFSLTRLGFAQTIATMGTNFSDFHVATLKKLNATIILFFDGDNAGVHANLKAARKLLKNGLKVKIVNNLTGADPDELIKTQSVTTVKTLLSNPLDPWDYALNKLQRLYDLSNYDQLKHYLEEIFSILKLNDEPIMVNQVLKELATLTGLDIAALQQSYNLAKTMTSDRERHHSNVAPLQSTNDFLPYRNILCALAASPRHIEIVEDNWGWIYRTIAPENINLITVLKTLIERYHLHTYQPNNWRELNEVLRQANFEEIGARWDLSPQRVSAAENQNLKLAFLALEEKYWRRKQEYYRSKIEATTDPETLHNYMLKHDNSHKELLNLKKKRNEWQWRK